jgi:DNA-binding transcriptional MerR regulator
MAPLYTPKQAAALLGISVSAVRLYTNTYAKHLSTQATGNPRRLTEEDLRLIAYVVSKTKTGQPHERVLAHLDSDEGRQEYDTFDWEAPGEEGEPGTALVSVAQLQAARLLLEDAQRREEEAREREKQLQEQINQLLRELGHKEGELETLRKSKPKGFWARLLGGGE